jgi:hypothetical protein
MVTDAPNTRSELSAGAREAILAFAELDRDRHRDIYDALADE